MTRKAPTGRKHAGCIDHIAHPVGPAGWLCISTRTENAGWPYNMTAPQSADGSRAEGPYIERRMVAVDRAANMVAFGDAIAESVAQHHAAELERRAVPCITIAERAIMDPVPGHKGAKTPRYPLPTGASASGTSHLPYDRAEDRAARVRMAAELAERTGRKYAPTVAEPVKARTAAPIIVAEPEPVPDALDLCNSCDVNAADPDSPAGYCADCERAAREPQPEPEPEPVQPATPVLAAVQPVQRPTCPRCGQLFRMHGTGLAWHLANRPDCAPARLAIAV